MKSSEKLKQLMNNGDPKKCWVWRWYKRGKMGYGSVRWEGKEQYAHRVAFELVNGPIPKDVLILHKCDCPACCNPSHLFMGTVEDNTLDMVQKGRVSCGERHPAARLTALVVKQIRESHSRGDSIYGLARRFSVSETTVRSVVKGRSWCHV